MGIKFSFEYCFEKLNIASVVINSAIFTGIVVAGVLIGDYNGVDSHWYYIAVGVLAMVFHVEVGQVGANEGK